MRALTVMVDVANPENGVSARRVAGLLDDNATIGVCAITHGDKIVNTELEFNLGEAAYLAERILGGDQRAKTTPGLARILAASVAVLFRVSLAAGALQKLTGDLDERRDDELSDDRDEATDDENQPD